MNQKGFTKILLFFSIIIIVVGGIIYFAFTNNPIAVQEEDSNPELITLEKIFSNMDSITNLSYQTKLRPPEGLPSEITIWIKEDKVKTVIRTQYTPTGEVKFIQIGEKTYSYFPETSEWKETSLYTSLITIITALKKAQNADDTKITGEEVLNGEDATTVEYTDSEDQVVKLWISNQNLVPVKIFKSGQKQEISEITNISFEEIDNSIFEIK